MYETKRDVILFCIDCSESMLKLYDDSKYEDVQTCHLYTAFEAAMQIQKKKIIVGPNDSFGILLFNTVRFKFWHSVIDSNVGPPKTRKSETTRQQGSEIKKNTFLFQPIGPLSAPKVHELIQLLDGLCRFFLIKAYITEITQSRSRESWGIQHCVSTSHRNESTYGWCLYKLQLGPTRWVSRERVESIYISLKPLTVHPRLLRSEFFLSQMKIILILEKGANSWLPPLEPPWLFVNSPSPLKNMSLNVWW